VFYLQARQEDRLMSLKLEKEQVLFLAGGLTEVMADLAAPADIPGENELELEQPVLAEWAVGSMQLAYDSAADRVLLVAREVAADDEDDPDATRSDEDGSDEDGSDEEGPDDGGPQDSAPDDMGPDDVEPDERRPEVRGPDGSAPGDSGAAGPDAPGFEVSAGWAALEADDPGPATTAVARLALTREQAAGVIEHGKRLLRRGRPPCPLCGFPLGDDHSCPKTNGHRAPAL
jgi:Protein of unknown function (DUF3090)